MNIINFRYKNYIHNIVKKSNNFGNQNLIYYKEKEFKTQYLI